MSLSASASAAEGETIFLAESSHDLHEERDALRRYLSQHGHTVLPDAPLPLVAEECTATLREQLGRCRMSIHLVGGNYSIVPEGTTVSLIELQNEIAVERGGADPGFARLIWMPPGLAAADARQQRLVDVLRTDPAGADLLETPIAELEAAVREKLRPPPEKGSAVFLATATFDLRAERDALLRGLEERGHIVLPDENRLPLYAEGCAAFLREQMAKCRLSIHLVGRHYGIVPEGTDESLAALQHQVAVERGAADPAFRRLVWMPPGLEVDDTRQERLIEALRAEPGVRLVEGSADELELAVRESLIPSAPEPSAPSDEELVKIYLLCDERDLEAVVPLEDALFDRGFEVVLPIFEGDEAEIREEHEENLNDCDAVVIYYGAADEVWQRRMVRNVKKGAYGRGKPPPSVAIWVALPATPRKKALRTREAVVLRPADGFPQRGTMGGLTPEDLEPFLRTLDGGPR